MANSYLKEKNEIDKIKDYSRNQLEIIYKKIVGYKNNVDYFDNNNNRKIDLNKYTNEDLIKQIKNFYKTHKDYKQLFIPEIPKYEPQLGGGVSKRIGSKKHRPNPNWKHPFLNI